jgi:membrane fusion protein (multidrug efflux system)
MKNILMNNTTTRGVAALLISGLILASCAKKGDQNLEGKSKEEKIAILKKEIDQLKDERAKVNGKIDTLQSKLMKETGDAGVRKKEVVAIPVKLRAFDHTVQTQGGIESLENIQLSAKTAGVITQVYVVEGEVVNAGQVLGQIDNSVLLRGVEELKARLELANTVFERQKNLWDQKIGTEVQYLQAKSSKESLERTLASMYEQNENTKIKSPIHGVVDEVQLRVGQNISPGMPAVRIINNEKLKVKANVSEAYVSLIKTGNKVNVFIPDLNKQIAATITFVGRNINALSRTFTVEAKLPSDPELRPNMSVVLKVVFESVSSAVVVPINVVQDINNQKVVFVAESEGGKSIARRHVVELAGVYDDQAQVKSGLKPGENLITVGYQGLNDGELINL